MIEDSPIRAQGEPDPDSERQDENWDGSESTRASLAIEITPNQIDQVVRGATDTGSLSILLSGQIDSQEMLAIASEPLGDPRISSSLLRGLLVFSVLPADGEPIGIVEVADRLNMSASTTHRYLTTLVLAGLVERDASSRKYRRAK
jgi:hypothetical protein